MFPLNKKRRFGTFSFSKNCRFKVVFDFWWRRWIQRIKERSKRLSVQKSWKRFESHFGDIFVEENLFQKCLVSVVIFGWCQAKMELFFFATFAHGEMRKKDFETAFWGVTLDVKSFVATLLRTPNLFYFLEKTTFCEGSWTFWTVFT